MIRHSNIGREGENEVKFILLTIQVDRIWIQIHLLNHTQVTLTASSRIISSMSTLINRLLLSTYITKNITRMKKKKKKKKKKREREREGERER